MSCAEGEQCLPSRVMYGLCVGQNKKPEACHMYLSVWPKAKWGKTSFSFSEIIFFLQRRNRVLVSVLVSMFCHQSCCKPACGSLCSPASARCPCWRESFDCESQPCTKSCSSVAEGQVGDTSSPHTEPPAVHPAGSLPPGSLTWLTCWCCTWPRFGTFL